MNNLLYTEKQAIAVTQLSRSTLCRLESEGKLHSVQVVRSVRYIPSELERFVAELQAAAQEGSQ